jgi:hypothetical protein
MKSPILISFHSHSRMKPKRSHGKSAIPRFVAEIKKPGLIAETPIPIEKAQQLYMSSARSLSGN